MDDDESLSLSSKRDWQSLAKWSAIIEVKLIESYEGMCKYRWKTIGVLYEMY